MPLHLIDRSPGSFIRLAVLFAWPFHSPGYFIRFRNDFVAQTLLSMVPKRFLKTTFGDTCLAVLFAWFYNSPGRFFRLAVLFP